MSQQSLSANQLRQNDPSLGTHLKINLLSYVVASAEAFGNLVEALGANTTITDLTLNLYQYEPAQQRNARFVQPILEYISSNTTKKRLRKLTIELAGCHTGDDFFQQIVTTVARSGNIEELCLSFMLDLDIQHLVLFCRENLGVKVLELRSCIGIDNVLNGVAVLAQHLQTEAPGSSRVLETLRLTAGTSFQSCQTATMFSDLIRCQKISALNLNGMFYDGASAAKFLLKLVSDSAAKRLELAERLEPADCWTALDAGKPFVEELSLICAHPGSFEALEESLGGMTKMKDLKIKIHTNIQPETKRRFLKAIDKCTTVERIELGGLYANDFSRKGRKMLQEVARRNRQLRLLVANPAAYPPGDLLQLMPKFDNSPQGRFEIACALPSILPILGNAKSSGKRKREDVDIQHSSGRRTS